MTRHEMAEKGSSVMSDQAWDETDRGMKRHASGPFGKLDTGASCTVAFIGGPGAFEMHWTPSGSVSCDGEGCALCKQGVPVKARVRINYIDLADNVVRIWEGSSAFFRDLKMLRKKVDFGERAFEITRSGTGKNTKYLILPDKPLTAEQKARIASASPHNLARQADAADEPEPARATPPAQTPSSAPSETTTIAPEIRDEFIARLRALKSKDAVNAFLGTFHCERISDVRAADVVRARQLLDTLEGKKLDINPFS